MRLRGILILRLVLAVVFALTAFIFTEVFPDIPPFNRIFLRIALTIWSGLIGFGLFPDFAKMVSTWVVHLSNIVTERLSTEIINQMLRLPKQANFQLPFGGQSPVGGVSVNQPLILDTSAIIDGRILDIAKANFLYGMVLVPQFILEELQQVADSSDYLKRTRARRGFEVIEDLKKVKGVRIEIWDKDIAGKRVDDKLIKLAKSLHGRIITTDYNLNKVATLSSVSVLNVNDLANAVKTLAIPGEKLSVRLIHLGKDPKQGIGYFPDGTMIVIEDGAEQVGKEIKAEVTRVLQVAAGRMVFARITPKGS